MNLDIVGHLSFLILACSFLVKDILWLRLFSIFASLCAVTFNYLSPITPMWVTIGWHSIFIITNTYHITLILYEMAYFQLSPKERELYQIISPEISALDFKKLLSLGGWESIKANHTLIGQGEFVTSLMLIFKGEVGIQIDNKEVASLGIGKFVGEMSFLTRKNATATVKSNTEAEYFIWEQHKLRNFLVKNPSLLVAVHSLLTGQISNALIQESKKKEAA